MSLDLGWALDDLALGWALDDLALGWALGDLAPGWALGTLFSQVHPVHTCQHLIVIKFRPPNRGVSFYVIFFDLLTHPPSLPCGKFTNPVRNNLPFPVQIGLFFWL